MCEYLHSIGVTHATCSRWASTSTPSLPSGATRDLRRRARAAARTRACWCSPAASPRRRTFRCCIEAFRRLGDPYHLLLIGGERARPRRQRHAHSVLPRQPRARQLLRVGRCLRACRHARNFRAGGARGHGLRPAGGRHARRRDAGTRRRTRRGAGGAARGPGRCGARISPAAIAALYERDLDALGARGARATWWLTTAGRARCRGSWRVTRPR